MNFNLHALKFISTLICVSNLTYGTFKYQDFTKDQLPYIEQAIALMRNGITAKKAFTTAPVKDLQENQIIHLTQRDFDSGTYRIRTPNTTIVLDTDINFEPIASAEATRTDKPLTGWFAAMTVEADNVVIDLNGKTLQATEFFLANDVENVFADIELDNSPFSGPLFGVLGAFFPGDTQFVSANNVVIKNGTLGNTDHWCIHGNNNSAITINNLHLKNFAVVGIELNGLINSTISDIKITGLERPIRTSFNGVIASTLIDYLITIANQPQEPCFAGACEQLASVSAYVAANPQMFKRTLLLPQAAFLGVEIASGFINFFSFPATPEICQAAAALSGGRTAENCTLENISISGLRNAPEESVLIGSQSNGQIINLPLLGIPVFGALTWDSAFDAQGNFAPSPLLLAQIFVIDTQLCLFPDIISAILPPNYTAIADSIKTGNEAEFLANTFPIFGIAPDSVQIKGTFGVRFDCSHNAKLSSIRTSDIHNVGAPGATLASIPAGSFYEGLVQEQRYIGNDAWGIELSTESGARLNNCEACSISSLHGQVFGVDLISHDSGTIVNGSLSKGILGFSDDVNSAVNPPAEVYGFRVKDNSGPITFNTCRAKNIISPRSSFGFAAETTNDVKFIKCISEKISATSSIDLVASPKEAFGFQIEDAHNTLLCNVTAKDISITGESGVSESASVAAGISIDSQSSNTTIICPIIEHISGGAGVASKISNEGSNTSIKNKNCKK